MKYSQTTMKCTFHSTCPGISFHYTSWQDLNDCAGKSQGFYPKSGRYHSAKIETRGGRMIVESEGDEESMGTFVTGWYRVEATGTECETERASISTGGWGIWYKGD